MSKRGKRLQKGIFAGARAARMTPEEFAAAVCEEQEALYKNHETIAAGTEEVPELPDTEAMLKGLASLELIFWDEDYLTLFPEEIENFRLKDVRLGTFFERGGNRRMITCRSAILEVGPKADRTYRTMYLTTEHVLQRMCVRDVASFGITYRDDDGRTAHTLIRLPWISRSGFRVNVLEEFTMNAGGGATLAVRPRES